MDDVFAGMPPPHHELSAARQRFQLDVDLPVGLDDSGSLRQVGVLQRERQATTPAKELRSQQDKGCGMVRFKLWR